MTEDVAKIAAGLSQLSRLKPCDACAGTGQTSPWEWDHYLWLNRVPHAVCGACRGSGLLTRWGFRLSRRRTAELRVLFEREPALLARFLRAHLTQDSNSYRKVGE